MDEKELAKQLSTYADAITGFAFVQGVAFGLLLGQSKDLPANVATHWCIAVPVIVFMTGGYLWMVWLCQGAEDKLLGIPSARGAGIGSVVPMIRSARLWLIIVMGIADLLVVIGQRLVVPHWTCL
jgi:hypothetical protein